VKKFLLVLLIASVLVVLLTSNRVINMFNNSSNQQINRSDYFKKLSLKYYDSDQFGKRLAFINQNVVHEDDALIIPTEASLIRMTGAFDLYAMDQKSPIEKANRFSQKSITIAFLEGSIIPPIAGLLILLAVVIGYIWGHNRAAKTHDECDDLKNIQYRKAINRITVRSNDELVVRFKEI